MAAVTRTNDSLRSSLTGIQMTALVVSRFPIVLCEPMPDRFDYKIIEPSNLSCSQDKMVPSLNDQYSSVIEAKDCDLHRLPLSIRLYTFFIVDR